MIRDLVASNDEGMQLEGSVCARFISPLRQTSTQVRAFRGDPSGGSDEPVVYLPRTVDV